MKTKKALLALLMSVAAAAQADYRAEISAALGSTVDEVDADDGDDYDNNHDYVDLQGEVFLQQVSTANGPLGEAAFLSKASSIALDLSSSEFEWDFDNGAFVDEKSDEDVYTLSGRFVIPGPNIILTAMLGQGEIDNHDFDADADIEVWALGGGAYIGDNISLEVAYDKHETDYDQGADRDEDGFTVSYKQVIHFGNGQALTLEPFLRTAQYEYSGTDFDGDLVSLGIRGTYYILRQLSVFGGIASTAADYDTGESTYAQWHAGIDYFINEHFRIGGQLFARSGDEDSDFELADSDYTGGGLEFDAAVRF